MENRLLSVQIMRGIAALSVTAFHTSLIMADPQYGAVHIFETITSRGWIGVNFFFVLSGFIIFHAHAKDIGDPKRLGRYFWRRFARIYPTYWLFLTAFIIAALSGLGAVDFQLSWSNLLSAYTLLPWTPHPSLPLKVAWTLMFEIFFYGMFALLILDRRLGLLAFAGWFAAILTASFYFHILDMGWMSMWNSHFFAGALALLLHRRLDPRWGPPMLAGGIALLLLLLATNPDYADIEIQYARPVGLLLLGVAFMLILAGCTITEKRFPLQPPRFLRLLGDASYTLYLVHSAAISFCCLLLFRFAPTLLPPPVAFILIFALAVVGGTIAHLVVERPLLRITDSLGKRLSRGDARAMLATPATVSQP